MWKQCTRYQEIFGTASDKKVMDLRLSTVMQGRQRCRVAWSGPLLLSCGAPAEFNGTVQSQSKDDLSKPP